MKRWINLGLLAGAGMALVLAAGAAMAQTAVPAPPPPPAAGAEAAPRPVGPGMYGPRHGWGRAMPPMNKAAVFHVSRGDSRIDVRCAESETMKACADAAAALFDKLPAMPQ